jgi:hypothetical protein
MPQVPRPTGPILFIRSCPGAGRRSWAFAAKAPETRTAAAMTDVTTGRTSFLMIVSSNPELNLEQAGSFLEPYHPLICR